MHSHGVIARVLARELVDLARAEGTPGPFMTIPQAAVLDRWAQLLGRRYRFLRPLLRRVVGQFASARYFDASSVAQFLCGDSRFRHYVDEHELSISWLPGCGPSMRPIGRAAVPLTALCTNRTPEDVVSAGRNDSKRRLYRAESREDENGLDQTCGAGHEAFQAASALYGGWHLPQGAPTSPALANRCFYKVDRSIGDYCRAAGVTYTRYADDLTFSSSQADWVRSSRRFSNHIAAILLRFGYRTHHRKTRIRSSSQQQTVTGVVVNERVNCDRREYDTMKAILFNCVRHGPTSQNRDRRRNFRSHLQGRIGHVAHLNAARGAKLRALFDRIEW